MYLETLAFDTFMHLNDAKAALLDIRRPGLPKVQASGIYLMYSEQEQVYKLGYKVRLRDHLYDLKHRTDDDSLVVLGYWDTEDPKHLLNHLCSELSGYHGPRGSTYLQLSQITIGHLYHLAQQYGGTWTYQPMY